MAKNYDLLLVEDYEGCKVLAVAPSGYAEIGGIAVLDGALCQIIGMAKQLARKDMDSIADADCVYKADAVYNCAWKDEKKEEKNNA